MKKKTIINVSVIAFSLVSIAVIISFVDFKAIIKAKNRRKDRRKERKDRRKS